MDNVKTDDSGLCEEPDADRGEQPEAQQSGHPLLATLPL